MGGCVSKKSAYSAETVIRSSQFESRGGTQNQNPENNQNNTGNANIGLSNEEKFKDMEEWEDEYSGEGIKRIKAYKCSMQINELQMLRYEFWSSKKENRRHWQIIQRACETDPGTAEIILNNAGFMCLEGNMKCIIDTNSTLVFNVPNFCINDPMFKKEFADEKAVPEKILHITLIHVFKNLAKYEVKISNKRTGADLKAVFIDKEALNKEEYKIRLLYKGAEIKDADSLSIYNFDNHPQVQVSCNKIEPENEIRENEK